VHGSTRRCAAQRAESLLHEWVVRAILQSEKRAARFRSLGRGWIFIQLSSNGVRHAGGKALDASEHRTRFKWWFEGCVSLQPCWL
jgi:hypothetical protein